MNLMNKEENNKFIIYENETGETHISVKVEDETVWLTQAQMVELFQSSKSNISEHIKHIFEDDELEKSSVVRKFRTTALDGKNYNIEYYNLDMIISLGYRIKSFIATRFRQWATNRLKEYIIKGFTMDDERLKNLGGGDYWKELLDRIRDIRSSEKVLYKQVLNLYATSIDYNPKSEESILFFKTIQNKLHYAAHGKTAAEIILDRANAGKPFMGLLNFSKGGVSKRDIIVAKNYLDKKELKILNNIVSAFFDLAEVKAEDHKKMYMKDWIVQLDKLINLFDKKILTEAGLVSHETAMKKAEIEYQKYQVKTSSSAEKDYLESIKIIEEKVKTKDLNMNGCY